MTRRCDGCVHFHNLPWHPNRVMRVAHEDGRIETIGTRQVGECRARPPERGSHRPSVWEDTTRAYWPIVHGEEWCGSFVAAREPEKAR